MAIIIFQHRIYRSDLQNNPNILYVFGDNLQREGMGGQAGHMRGEPNAIGIATKRAPSCNDGDFFSDKYEELGVVRNDLATLLENTHRPIVVPSDGIGTGLSELPQRSPMIHKFIKQWFLDNLAVTVPWN
jgi:hypothetical protein